MINFQHCAKWQDCPLCVNAGYTVLPRKGCPEQLVWEIFLLLDELVNPFQSLPLCDRMFAEQRVENGGDH